MPSGSCKSGRRDLHALGAYFWRTFLRLGDDDLLSTSICSMGEGWLFMARRSCWKKDGAPPSYFGTRPGSGATSAFSACSHAATNFTVSPCSHHIHVFLDASEYRVANMILNYQYWRLDSCDAEVGVSCIAEYRKALTCDAATTSRSSSTQHFFSSTQKLVHPLWRFHYYERFDSTKHTSLSHVVEVLSVG